MWPSLAKNFNMAKTLNQKHANWDFLQLWSYNHKGVKPTARRQPYTFSSKLKKKI